MEHEKFCSKCGENKSLDKYHNNKDTRDGKQAKCKECSSKFLKEYYANNKERMRVKYNNNKESIKNQTKEYRVNNRAMISIKRWKKQGIKHDQFEDLFDLYNEATHCYLCNIQYDNTSRNKKVLDHDHLSGCPRFICCSSCNIKLGRIDNIRKDVLLDIHRYYFTKLLENQI